MKYLIPYDKIIRTLKETKYTYRPALPFDFIKAGAKTQLTALAEDKDFGEKLAQYLWEQSPDRKLGKQLLKDMYQGAQHKFKKQADHIQRLIVEEE